MILKVHLARVLSIPSKINFVEKCFKVEDEKHNRYELWFEALACPVMHHNIIKFSFLNPFLMEVYTLWRNGGSLYNFWPMYKVLESLEYGDTTHVVDFSLTPKELEMVKTYDMDKFNLELSLFVIMDKCHQQDIIHNNLSLVNELLHFYP